LIRVQKYLADAGVASRRKVEGWIAAGRLTVNGRPAIPGLRVAGDEQYRLDGRPLRFSSSAAVAARVIAYNKPEGELVTRGRRAGRPTVFTALPRLKGRRWVAVGRLDLNSSGLLLLTTDGALAHRLMHPSFGMEREYLVRCWAGPAQAPCSASSKACCWMMGWRGSIRLPSRAAAAPTAGTGLYWAKAAIAWCAACGVPRGTP